MRVLWLSNTYGLYPIKNNLSRYNGGGWTKSLQELILSHHNIELGFVFISPQKLESKQINNCTYFPIESHKLTFVKKLAKYYGLTKKASSYVTEVLDAIQSFSPDLIHIFGLENPMIDIIHHTNIPVVVHLQGLLGPNANAFWPVGFNSLSFFWPFSLREWIIRNGYRYEKANMLRRSKIEEYNFSKIKHVMGRTEWDYQVTNIMAPQCNYYHVDEVLRNPFYEKSGRWVATDSKFIIMSTISDTMYKGLDVIMKTAKILKEKTNIDYEWHIAGINKSTRIVKFFENKLGYTVESVGITLCGVLSEDRLCEKLLQSSLFVHPSYIDNSPNSVCEAQLLGLPVIACNVGGVSSLIKHKSTGILVPANAPYEMAYWIKEINRNEQLKMKLSRGECEFAKQRHNKTIIVKSLIDCYKTILTHNL